MDEEFRLWYIWPRRLRSAGSLPPGQGVIKGFPRFGDAFLGEPLPTIPAEPVLTIRGAVDTEHTIPLTELDKLPRQEMVSDFHCVTTWTKQGLRWGGVRFRDFYGQVVIPITGPAPDVGYLLLVGWDGYKSTMVLEDALADDVLLADHLDGQALPPEHGAPLRLVSPRQYGYKSTKHLCAIELWTEPPPSKLGRKAHPRARVELEERHATIPGCLLRWPYRLAIPLVAYGYHRAARRNL